MSYENELHNIHQKRLEDIFRCKPRLQEKTSNFQGSFTKLPYDILISIIHLLELKHIAVISRLNWEWHLFMELDDTIWKCYVMKMDIPLMDKKVSSSINCWKCFFQSEENLQWDRNDICYSKRPRSEGNNMKVTKHNRTVLNSSGGMNSIPLKSKIFIHKSTLLEDRRFTIRVDKWTQNGSMIGIVKEDWWKQGSSESIRNHFPGTGNGMYPGITSNENTIGWYSSSGQSFCSGDLLDVLISMKNRTAMFFRNGEFIGEKPLPEGPILRLIACFFGSGHQFTLVKSSLRLSRLLKFEY